MMKKSLVFGAGSVGRGFIGQLLSESGLEVTFADVDPAIIEGINQESCYPHITVSNNRRETKLVQHAHAIDSSNEQQVIQMITQADLIATSVGAAILPRIANVFAKGIHERISLGLPPVNVLLCENLHHAASFMRQQLLARLEEADRGVFDDFVGLLETSIGRMIPVPSEETRAIHPAAVCVESYKFLPYDVHAVKGQMPEIAGLIGDKSVPFMFYSDRKLYVHNLGHCICAYIGEFYPVEYISEAISIPEVRYFVRAAMFESALALSRKYHKDLIEIIEHIEDLLYRFGNSELKDTIVRVGRDPVRKLAPEDRFLGAFGLCCEMKVPHRYISLGLAFGLNKLRQEKGWTMAECSSYLHEQTEAISNSEREIPLIIEQLKAISKGVNYNELIQITTQDFGNSKIV